jgi:hypothetical protein
MSLATILSGGISVANTITDSEYAIVQHEDMTFTHKVGRAKFLESAINDAEAGMLARIAKRIELNRGVA